MGKTEKKYTPLLGQISAGDIFGGRKKGNKKYRNKISEVSNICRPPWSSNVIYQLVGWWFPFWHICEQVNSKIFSFVMKGHPLSEVQR